MTTTKQQGRLVTVAIERGLYKRLQKLRRDSSGYLRTVRRTLHEVLVRALDREEGGGAS